MEMSIRFPHLNLGFDYVPKSFQVFGFEITIYGILIAVGMLLGIAFVVLEAKRSNQNQDRYLDMMIISLAASVAGARLFYVGFSWTLYKSNLMEIFNLRSGGCAFYGGLLGGVVAAAIFCYICKLSFWQMADTASMGILIGQTIGRWGNFFNRESFGEYTDSIFAMQLPISAVRSGEVTAAMRENLITEGGISFVQVQPVFLYESLWCLVLFLFLLAVRRRKKFQGELFMRYLAGYGLGRFFCEWLRTDQLYIPGTRIGVSLVISAVLFLIFAPTICTKRVMSQKRAAAKKLRREKVYEAEEKAYQESQNQKEIRTDSDSSELQKQTEGNVKENPKETDNGQTADSQMETQKIATGNEQAEDSENWENSEYAHISDTWRTVAQNEEIQDKNRTSAEERAEDASSLSNPFSAEAFERRDKEA